MEGWIDRAAGDAIRALARSFPVVLVTGPRQVGKTSLLRRLYPTADFVTFDDPSLARQAEDGPSAFFGARSEPLVLDEVQYVPAIFRSLKQRVDSEPRRRGRFLLTGSQTFALMQNVSESLAGRCGVLSMDSLSLPEIRAHDPTAGDPEVLVRGGFPALWAEGVPRSDWYASYLATYLERDVRNLRNVGSLRDFDRFLRALALRTGQLLSYSDLARDVGITPNTAKAWVSILEASGQIFLLEPYHRSLGKRLVKSPKAYFMDTGLACHLVGIGDATTFFASPLCGPLWETFVVGQVVRKKHADRADWPLWFFRSAGGDEVDLLVERGGRFVAIECKLAEHPGADALRGFEAMERFYRGEDVIERAFVACRTAAPYPLPGAGRVQAVSTADLMAAI